MQATTKPRIGAAEIRTLVQQASQVHDAVRAEMLAPHPRKIAPRFTAQQIAELIGLEKSKFDSRLRGTNMPAGHIADGKRRRTFSLDEVRAIVSQLKSFPSRPVGAPGYTMACVNFKGGSTKTSTIFNIAQGLALRGRRVLLIDLDPQGSTSTLTGLMPHTELTEADTAGLLFSTDSDSAQKSLEYAIRETYWSGIDVVPACGALNSAELILPQMAAMRRGQWWNVLNAALDAHRAEYDYILLDTAPSLSYLAVNAAYAADGLLMPLPPQQLDYSAALMFWDMLLEIITSIQETSGAEKAFKSIGVVLSKVNARPVAAMMRGIIQQSFAPYVLGPEIPSSEANDLSGISFGTIHDLVDDDGVARTSNKLRQAFDRLVDTIDGATVASQWGAR